MGLYTRTRYTHMGGRHPPQIMGEYRMDDPDETGTKSADSQGRLFLGKEYEGETIEYAIKVVSTEDEQGSVRKFEA